VLRPLGISDYAACWRTMRAFTDRRGPEDDDELWITQHPPVYTLGQAGRREHLLDCAGIPVVSSDRGGQVTYHGPGQTVVYVLLDLRRLGVGVKRLVNGLEAAIIALLAEFDLCAERRDGAPGVYVADAKIAALGLRIRNGCSYHGVALNVDMDLAPFAGINPCGFEGMAVTHLRAFGPCPPADDVGLRLARAIALELELALHLGDAGPMTPAPSSRC
jgi:lipoyl(octanoyl) transferase